MDYYKSVRYEDYPDIVMLFLNYNKKIALLIDTDIKMPNHRYYLLILLTVYS